MRPVHYILCALLFGSAKTGFAQTAVGSPELGKSNVMEACGVPVTFPDGTLFGQKGNRAVALLPPGWYYSGRDAEGNHTFADATALGTPSLPVSSRRAETEWECKCDDPPESGDCQIVFDLSNNTMTCSAIPDSTCNDCVLVIEEG